MIGGGIIGLALAYKLIRTCPSFKVTVFEKEPEVGRHQSSHNSGVLHAGLYYKPGSLKAKLAVDGLRQMKAFCSEFAIAHESCGKLVVATSDDEVPRLRDLLDRGTQNGLRGLEWLEREQIPDFEPNVAGVAAVRVPEEGIVDYPQVCQRLRELIEAAGGRILTGFRVQALTQNSSGWSIRGDGQEASASFLFNCAGLHCDRVFAMAGEKRRTRIIPFRGEYFVLQGDARKLVRNLVYPVPDPRFPFLGVHFTRMIHGGVEAGPNAVLAFAREAYRWSTVSVRDTADVISFSGFWRFLAKYPSMSTYELYRSLSKAEFCRSLQRLVPAVREQDLAPGVSGIRAQAISPDGLPCQDFELVLRPAALHLINAPSPGATASLAIADHLLVKAAPALGLDLPASRDEAESHR